MLCQYSKNKGGKKDQSASRASIDVAGYYDGGVSVVVLVVHEFCLIVNEH